MAVKIELKRSAIPGKVPTVEQLDLGELAINTYDGTVYLKQDNGTPQIIQLATNTSGSVVASASYAVFAQTAGFAQGGSGTFTGIFSGNGSGLTGVTASAFLGDPFRIASGSATASIAPNTGFQINTNTSITGSLNLSVTSSQRNVFLIKDITTNTDYVKVNNQGVLSLGLYASPPTAVDGGMYFDTSGTLYLGIPLT
jgi:hypothetical protein